MYTKAGRIIRRALSAGVIAAFAGATYAGEIKVLSDSPLQPALTKVADLFHLETHHRVNLQFDPSPAVKKRIENGEIADVVIVQPDFVEELTRMGKVSPGDRPLIGRVGVGLGNRVGSPIYDISTPEKLKETLLGADTLVFNNVVSGNTFAKALEKLGVADALKSKIVRTSPNGIFEPVLKGKGNDFVAGTIPLIATTPGIKLLGPLPGDLQNYLTYTAVMMTNASDRQTAEQFIRFLTSSRGKEAFAANGVK
jgi:molybdate transport system substrate-binding protein